MVAIKKYPNVCLLQKNLATSFPSPLENVKKYLSPDVTWKKYLGSADNLKNILARPKKHTPPPYILNDQPLSPGPVIGLELTKHKHTNTCMPEYHEKWLYHFILTNMALHIHASCISTAWWSHVIKMIVTSGTGWSSVMPCQWHQYGSLLTRDRYVSVITDDVQWSCMMWHWSVLISYNVNDDLRFWHCHS